MATSCTIIKKNDDGTFTESSIRSDGYLTGVGLTLFKHYISPAKIDQLLALGWVSPLEEEIEDHGPGETFDGEYPKIWPANQRDECMNTAALQGYVYLWEDRKWFVGEGQGDYNLQTGYESVTFNEITRDYLIKNADVWSGEEVAAYLDSTEKREPFFQTFHKMHLAAVERDKDNPRVIHLPNAVITGDFTPSVQTRQGVLFLQNNKFHLQADEKLWPLVPAAQVDATALEDQISALTVGDSVQVHVFQEIKEGNILIITGIEKV